MGYKHQVLKGRGILVSHRSGKEYEVAYRFDVTIKSPDVVPGAAPRPPAPQPKVEARGSVKTLDGVMLPNEHYDLLATDAKHHVWRDAERWHIEPGSAPIIDLELKR